MNKQELHDFIGFRQPNICQIVAYKDGVEVYTDEWNGYKKTILVISCQQRKVLYLC
ncbi:hypothetical protein EfmAA242_09930 [Enterococcus faecium]|nr:hypothetical protein EfmAA242_09930 [Enterococcus faecium]